jgi:Putative MetA-pathway of phenol degradation
LVRRYPQLLIAGLMWILVLGPVPSIAQDRDTFIGERLQVSARADASQPHWIAPLFTTTPRLLEQLRFDIATQSKAGFETTNFGGGKGLELIPFANTEILISTPPFVSHDKPGLQDGVGDMSFLLKYRVASGNEEGGNYVVTAFLGGSVPTGSYSNGATSAMITPTIAAGKGWGKFDFQTTFGINVPTEHMDKLGTPLAHNIAFQYYVLRKLWPEVEVNSTFWANGSLAGDKQVFLSPGLIGGKFHLWRRLGVTVGGGVQFPVTHFHTVDRTYLTSVRFPF